MCDKPAGLFDVISSCVKEKSMASGWTMFVSGLSDAWEIDVIEKYLCVSELDYSFW